MPLPTTGNHITASILLFLPRTRLPQSSLCPTLFPLFSPQSSTLKPAAPSSSAPLYRPLPENFNRGKTTSLSLVLQRPERPHNPISPHPQLHVGGVPSTFLTNKNQTISPIQPYNHNKQPFSAAFLPVLNSSQAIPAGPLLLCSLNQTTSKQHTQSSSCGQQPKNNHPCTLPFPTVTKQQSKTIPPLFLSIQQPTCLLSPVFLANYTTQKRIKVK